MKYKIYLSYQEAHLIRCKDTTIGNFPQVLPSVRIFDANSIDDVKSNITEMRNALARHYYLELEQIRTKHDKDLQALDRLESTLSLSLFTDTSAN
jgi:hypothetical protein